MICVNSTRATHCPGLFSSGRDKKDRFVSPFPVSEAHPGSEPGTELAFVYTEHYKEKDMKTYGKRISLLYLIVPVIILAFSSCVTGAGSGEQELRLFTAEETYISPESSKGDADIMEVPVVLNGKGKIDGYTFEVVDGNDNPVFTLSAESDSVVKELVLPDNFIWDGKTSEGGYAPEGRYRYSARVVLRNGTELSTKVYSVIVDNTPPSLTVTLPYTVFSPNGDSEKDLLILEQEGTSEKMWTGVFLASDGTIVKAFEWNDQAPPNIQWNGKNDESNVVPDGEYSYIASAVDEAGNNTRVVVENIRVDTTAAQLKLSREYKHFSPNNDGNRDSQTFTADVPRPGEVVSWKIAVNDAENDERAALLSGDTDFSDSVTFNGRRDNGEMLPEGEYYALGSIEYRNGSRAESRTESFILDVTAPEADVSRDMEIFSPNGDGNKENMTFTQSSSKEQEWTGAVTSGNGDRVRLFTWKGTVPETAVWKGLTDEGNPAPNGTYTYTLSATDEAGNSVQTEPVSFTLDRSEVPQIALKPEFLAFSPNADGTKDTLTVDIQLAETENISGYAFRIMNSSGESVYEMTGEGNPGSSLVWKGADQEGEMVTNGTYSAYLRVEYRNGNAPSVTSEDFILDRNVPDIRVTAGYTLFSPDGDGHRDKLPFEVTSTDEELWEGRIVDSDENVVRSVVWNGTVPGFTWDGTDNDGSVVQDGVYHLTIASTDRAGNSGSARVSDIEVDTAPTPVAVTAASDGFSPNGDDVRDSVQFNLYADVSEGIEAWELDIRSSDTGETVRTIREENTFLAEHVRWDGTGSSGAVVPDGMYSAMLTVTYEKGNMPTAGLETAVTIDTVAPELGLTVNPRRFSPDGDGFNDTTTISLAISENNAINRWRIRILDPKMNRFRVFSGKTKNPSSIRWDGTSADGELVQAADTYTAVATAEDSFGNKTELSEPIETDVFVVEEDGELKIQISSIHFVPDEADFTNLDEEQAVQNRQTLDRLAEILKRYDDYTITVEGHATHEYLQDPASMEWEQETQLIPLSRKRAEAVMDALVERGVRKEQLTSEGVGGAEPVVPFNDLENRWKNRRVEFILVRNEDNGS